MTVKLSSTFESSELKPKHNYSHYLKFKFTQSSGRQERRASIVRGYLKKLYIIKYPSVGAVRLKVSAGNGD